MQHCKKILRELGRLLYHYYCPAAQMALPFSEGWCRDCLMFAVSDYWKFKYERLKGERTFADALNGIKCSSAMKEALAILHYAKTDTQVAALMPKLFLDLEGKQRLAHTPYWNRFVEEYYKEKKPKKKSVPLREVYHILENLEMNALKKAVEKGKRLMREKGRK